MSCDHEILNRFLVEIFNEILRTEERCITQGGYDDLSIRELHVIEAVCQCAEKGKNTASDIAALLDVVPGTLTVSTVALERKGYLTRSRDALDRRVVRICPTDKGLSANADHALFHRRMTDQVLNLLSEEETVVFMRALDRLTQFFHQECGAHAGTCQNHLQNKEKTS